MEGTKDLPGVAILPVDLGREKLQLGCNTTVRGSREKGSLWQRTLLTVGFCVRTGAGASR